MIKSGSVLIIAATLCVFESCKHKAADSKAGADSANTAKIDTAEKDSGKMTAISQGISVDKDDAKFAVEAANGSMAEVELGKLGLNKGTAIPVKNFAAMMVNDHGRAGKELTAIAQSKGISLPSVTSHTEQIMETDLNQKAGKDFDKAYVDNMVDDHQEDVKEFENAVKTLKDPQLKAFAAKMLPMLKMHLDSAQAIKKRL